MLIVGLQLRGQHVRTPQPHWRQFHVDQAGRTGHWQYWLPVLQTPIGKHQAALQLVGMAFTP